MDDQNNKKIEKLEGLAKLLDTDHASVEEVAEVIQAVLEVVADARKQAEESLNQTAGELRTETDTALQTALTAIEQKAESLLKTTGADDQKVREELMNEIDAVAQMIRDIPAPKTVDEESIVNRAVSQAKKEIVVPEVDTKAIIDEAVEKAKKEIKPVQNNVTRTILGGGSGVEVHSNGSNVVQRAKSLNFTGATVTSTNGQDVTVAITGGGAVDSVNGQTGVVVLDTDDIDEGSTNLYWKGWTKTVVVDKGGLGDYTTIKDACDYVATQSPSTSNRWQILVMNGKYLESPFTVPTFTTVNGFIPTTWGNFESVEINMTTTFTSGTGIDMTGTSNLANLTVIWSDFTGSQTGDIDLILARGNNKMAGVYIQAWTADAATLNAVKVTGGTFYSNNLTIEYGNFGAGVGRGIYETGGNFSGYYDKSRFRGYIASQWGYEKDTTAGASILFDCVFDGPASAKRTGSGTVTMQLGSYVLNSGTITYVGKTSVADEAYGSGWDGSQEVPTKNALYDKIETVVGTIPDNLTDFTGQTAWRVFYSNTDGDVTELALGADGTFLKSNGATSAPSFATPAGSGDVSKVGTPVNNQVGVWTGDGTLEGDANLTFDGSTLSVSGSPVITEELAIAYSVAL